MTITYWNPNGLLQMCPCFSLMNEANQCRGYSCDCCKAFLANLVLFAFFANCPNLVFVQFGAWASFTLEVCVSLGLRMNSAAIATCDAIFSLCILRVLFGGPKEEVVRAHACPVIAVMANKKTFRDLPKVKLPRIAMSRDGFSVETPESSVTAGKNHVFPFPAAFGQVALEGLRPKSLWIGSAGEAQARAKGTTHLAVKDGATAFAGQWCVDRMALHLKASLWGVGRPGATTPRPSSLYAGGWR